jgi:hypothetical protein
MSLSFPLSFPYASIVIQMFLPMPWCFEFAKLQVQKKTWKNNVIGRERERDHTSQHQTIVLLVSTKAQKNHPQFHQQPET